MGLASIFRRRIFWLLYALGLGIFLMFFFGQYLLAWAEAQATETSVQVGMIRMEPGRLISILRDVLMLNGRAETFGNFFWWQGYMVMVVLALAGSILVGNDFQFGSLPFYLSKPIDRWHYVVGKLTAVGVFVNLMTTLPALVLFFQYGFLESWGYFFHGGWLVGRLPVGGGVDVRLPNPLFFGILGYGLVLTVSLSLFLVATASWLRRTIPLIMAWTTLFLFLRLLANSLVDGLQYDPRWRLIDLWNSTGLLGNACLGLGADALRSSRQPPLRDASLVLMVVCILCVIYLSRRIRAVEVVR
jgi:hypothetical protein